MGWASAYIERLQAGERVEFRPRGNSMEPLIFSGQLCQVNPCDTYQVGDIVLCKVNGREYLHKIRAIRGEHFQIGNNKGHVNGWVPKRALFGRLSKVSP